SCSSGCSPGSSWASWSARRCSDGEALHRSPDDGRVGAMSRRVIPGLESPDPVLEREIRGRLDEVETALEKAVRADSDMLAETAQYLLAAGGKRFRPILVLLSGYFGDP